MDIGPRVYAIRRLMRKLPELNYLTVHQVCCIITSFCVLALIGILKIVELLYDIANADDRVKEEAVR